jgi:AcrR family transcriptional regulator
MKKPDRRKPRTERLLREALIALIAEKGYEATTVQDIVDRANLGRATFYLHYDGVNGKEQLLASVAAALFTDLQAQIGAPSREALLTPLHPTRAIPFQHALHHRNLYQAVLANPESKAAMVRVMQSYVTAYVGTAADAGRAAHVPVDALTSYLAGAVLALMSWWLEDQRTTVYSAADIAELFYAMTLPVLERML